MTTATEQANQDYAEVAARDFGPIPTWANLAVADEVAAMGLPLSVVVPEAGFPQPEAGRVSRTLAILRWLRDDNITYRAPAADDVVQLRHLVGEGGPLSA